MDGESEERQLEADVVFNSMRGRQRGKLMESGAEGHNRNRNHNLQTSKAPLESQAQGTSLSTSAASSQKGCPKE